jgi:competence protein ComFA
MTSHEERMNNRLLKDEKTTLPKLASLLEGKLLTADEIPLDQSLIKQLKQSNLLKTKPALTTSLFTTTCTRCGNRDKKEFATISCKRCTSEHPYCRKCIEMGRMMTCELLYYWNGPPANWPHHENPCSWEGTLTPSQEKAAARITASILNKEKEILIWAVCGAGKTEMLYPGIAEALKAGKRICLATPRKDVVRELKPRLEEAFETIPIQALYGGSEEKGKDAQFVIATTHQLLRYENAFDVMIIDEVDAFPFHADQSLPFAQKRAGKPSCTTIYLTATPRADLKQAIRRGKLAHQFVPIRYHGHPLPVPKLIMCYSLQKELSRHQIPSHVFSWFFKRKNPARQVLIFVPTVELSTQLTQPLQNFLLKNQLIRNKKEITAVHASDGDRDEKVTAFRKREIKVLITTTILERGVTFPSVDVLVIDAGHEVFDEAALVQIAGRAGRNAADPTGEILFFHDGKTEAMLEAIYSIKQMNKRGGFPK